MPSTKTLMCSRITGPLSTSRFRRPGVRMSSAAIASATVAASTSQRRIVPDGSMAVWRTRDSGDRWERQAAGLPQENAYVGVLREAMSVVRDELP